MNLTEQKFWYLIKDHLPGDTSRVENSVDNGMPDINGSYIIDYWVELKVCNNKKAIRDITTLLRDTQIVWNITRGKQGALIFVMVRYETEIIIYKWNPERFNNRLENIPEAYIELGRIKKEKSFNWPLFKEIIKGQIQERINYGICNSRAAG